MSRSSSVTGWGTGAGVVSTNLYVLESEVWSLDCLV